MLVAAVFLIGDYRETRFGCDGRFIIENKCVAGMFFLGLFPGPMVALADQAVKALR